MKGFSASYPEPNVKYQWDNLAPAGTTLIQNTGVWVRNMDVWVHSSMAGLFLFWRDFKEIFPILIFIGVFVIFPVIYVMFRRRRKKGENPEEK